MARNTEISGPDTRCHGRGIAPTSTTASFCMASHTRSANASTMAPGVRAALVAVFRAKTGAGAADGEAWLAGLRSSNRYLEDIWGETAVV